MFNRKSILIVEENCFVALDLALAVEDLDGCVIGPAASAEHALELLETHRIAGALLDCELADGEVARVALTLIERGVPLIVHIETALPPALARAHPGLPVLMKPLKPALLVRLLAEQIENHTLKVAPAEPGLASGRKKV